MRERKEEVGQFRNNLAFMRNELEQEQNKKNLLEAEVKKVRVVFSYME